MDIMKFRKFIAALLIAAIVLSLTACQSSDYKKAVELQEGGYYEEAIELFTKLGDYKDSSARLSEARNAIEYQIASQLMDNQKYDEAAERFASIAGFRDADSLAAECREIAEATAAFDAACEYVREQNRILNEAMEEASNVVLSGEKADDESLRGAVASAVIAAEDLRVSIPRRPESPAEMLALAETLNATDYTEALANISETLTALLASIGRYNRSGTKDAAAVIERLRRMGIIGDVVEVPAADDPNGIADKGEGYITSVVFSSAWLDQDKIPGDTLAEKGCLAGGQIEFYETEEQARIRSTNLIPSDLTAATQYTGQHEVLGNLVLRISVLLDDRSQTHLRTQVLAELVKEG